MSELITKILKEAEVLDHFYDRLKQRLSDDVVTLAVEVSHMSYQVIGTYKMPEAFRTNIFKAIDMVEEFNFPRNKSFGIKLGQMKFNESLINFSSLTARQIYYKSRNAPVIYDPQSNSNGDVVYAIVRNNNLITFYWGKSYTKQTPEKLKVDMVIDSIEVLRKALVS